jgi:4a-hydroxytetrahydrobiopterin dehydratase
MTPTVSNEPSASAIFRKRLALFEMWVTWLKPKAIHPDISFGWGYATISLRTKKIEGLHENDFIMASKLDRMFDRPDGPPDHQ